MDAPPDLGPEARELWAVTVADLLERAVLREAHRPAIERYVRSVDLARRAWQAIPKTLVIRGSGTSKHRVPHPAIAVALRAEDAALKFGQALELDPASLRKRSAGGRPKGAASAPDRRDGRPGLRVVTPSRPADDAN
jgi:phage terminase small subunit